MEECGRGAAVEQLTARGMLSIPAMGGGNRDIVGWTSKEYEYQSPQWGAIEPHTAHSTSRMGINPRDGGAIAGKGSTAVTMQYQSPRWGAIVAGG